MDANKIFDIKASLLNKQIELIKSQPDELKGRGREALIQDFLEPFLPGNLGIDGGSVISSKGESSGEMDIIIYDKNGYDLFKPFAAFMPKKSKPIPAEVVYAVIEVESSLTPERLIKLAEKIKKLKIFEKKAYYRERGVIDHSIALYGKKFNHFPTLGIVFAYNSSSNLEELKKRMEEFNSQAEVEHQVDLVCILNQGFVAFFSSEKKMFAFPFEPGCTLHSQEAPPEENLKYFYLMLMRILAQAYIKPIRVLDYFKGDKNE